MPPDVQAALTSAVNAAAKLRAELRRLAIEVEQGNDAAIVLAARALVTGDPGITDRHSPDMPESRTYLGHGEGESHE